MDPGPPPGLVISTACEEHIGHFAFCRNHAPSRTCFYEALFLKKEQLQGSWEKGSEAWAEVMAHAWVSVARAALSLFFFFFAEEGGGGRLAQEDKGLPGV